MLCILVTGSSGMVGKSFKNLIEKNKECDDIRFIFPTRAMLDLTDFQAVKDYDFKKNHNLEKIDMIIHLAAKCGGLYENMASNYDFYTINNDITKSIFYLCRKYKIDFLVNVLSTCIFPDDDRVGILLESKNILNGPPHPSNSGYSFAKRNLYIESKLFIEKFPNVKVVNLIPTNMYGNGDSSNHVVPDLIKRCRMAKEKNTDFVIKGSGNAKRQFLFVDDFSIILMKIVLNLKQFEQPLTDIIVSPSESVSIKQLVNEIVNKLEFKGNVTFDTGYSDGQLVKMSNHLELHKYFKDFEFTRLSDGLDQILL